MSEQRPHTPSVWLWPLTLAAVVTALLALIVWRPASSALEREISARERERVEDQLAIIGTNLQQSLRSRVSILEGIAAFVASESTLDEGRSIRDTRERFVAYAGNLPLEKADILQAWIARSAMVTAVAPLTGNEDLLGRRRHPADGGIAPGETRVEVSDIAAPGGEALVTAVIELAGAGPPSVQVGIDFYAHALIEEANLGRYGRNIVVSLRDGGGRSVFPLGRGALVEPAIYPIGVSRGFWELAAVPAGGWNDAADRYVPIFRGGGWAASMLLGLLVLYTRSTRARRRRRTHRLEADILETEARFNEIASSIPGVIFRLVRKPSGAIQYSYLSEGARDVFGVESAQAAADSSWIRRTIHPDDRTRFDDMLGASAARRTPLTFEFRVVSNGGETKWLRSISLPRLCPNGDVIWTGHIADITDARHRLDLLEESEARFRAAFDAHPDGIALHDHDGGLVASNDAAQGMFGNAIPPLAKPGPESGQKPDAAATGLARIRRPDGASAWVLTDSRPIFRTGDAKPAGYLQTFTDVSDPHDREAGLIRDGRVYRDAVDSALDVLWRTDADLRFTAMDETASGEPHPIAGALIGTRLLDLHDADAEDGTDEIHRQIGSHEPFRNLRYDFDEPGADTGTDRGADPGPEAGAGRVFRFSGTAALDQSGIFLGYHGAAREEAIAAGLPELAPEQADLLAGLTRAADDLPVGIIFFDRGDQFVFRNRAFDLAEPHTDLIRPGISPAGFQSALRERGVTPPVPAMPTTADGEDIPENEAIPEDGTTPTAQAVEVDAFFEGWIGPHWLQIRRHDLEGDGTLFVVSDLTDLKDEEDHAAQRRMVDAAFEAACRIAADLNRALADSLGDLTRLKEGRGAGGDIIGRALASSERGAALGIRLLSLLQGRTSRPVQADPSAPASDTGDMPRAALQDQDRAEVEEPTAEAPARRTAIVLEPDPDVRRVTASLLRLLDYEVMDSGDAEDAIAYGDEAPADLLVTECRLPGAWTGETLAARLRRTAPGLRVVLTCDTDLGASGASFGEAAILLKPFGLDELSALVKWRDASE
ncbi:MAG: PAS domain-containing protein [Proteobacteria bacterium]|nr:PAS domain-containing protein [Pseudomonadota bacterium]